MRDRLDLAAPLGLISERESDSFRQSHDEHERCLAHLRKGLLECGISFSEMLRDDPWPTLENVTHVLTVGGDGTVLSVAHQVDHPLPVVGIRSSDSSIGYLCAYGHLEVEALISDLREGRLQTITVQRMKIAIERLSGQVPTEFSPPILNEVLFSHSHPAGTARYVIEFGGKREMQRSSGVWISTAMGSTGAMAAAGGTRLDETGGLFQFCVRELFHPPSGRLTIAQGVFDPALEPLIVENRSDNSLLAFDGLHGSAAVGFGERFRVARATPLLLARRSGQGAVDYSA